MRRHELSKRVDSTTTCGQRGTSVLSGKIKTPGLGTRASYVTVPQPQTKCTTVWY